MKTLHYLLVAFGCLLYAKATAQVSSTYHFNLQANEVPMFNAGTELLDSTVFYDWSLEYDLDQLAADLGMSGNNVFDWRLDLGWLDLSPIANIQCCGEIGWDVNFGFGVGSALYMRHLLEQGTMTADIPYQLDVQIPDYSRGDTILVSLASSYTATPSFEFNEPVITKDLITTLDILGNADATFYIGPFGTYTQEFFNFNKHYEATLLHVGQDGFYGDLGLVQNPLLTVFQSSEFSFDGLPDGLGSFSGIGDCLDGNNYTPTGSYYYDHTNDEGVTTSYESNLCWSQAPCLQDNALFQPMDYWPIACKLRVPFVAEMIQDLFGEDLFGEVVAELSPFATEPWFTTAPEVSIDWPMGLTLDLRYPDDEMVYDIPAWANGVLKAGTVNPEPYFDLGLNYLDLLEDILSFACPPEPLPPLNPYVCPVQDVVDMRKSDDNDLLRLYTDDQGRVSVHAVINQLSNSNPVIALAWGEYDTYELGVMDVYAEWNLLDLENHFTITNEFDAEYVPEVRVELEFAEPITYRLGSGSWQESTTVDMPMDGDFELVTTCEDYEIGFVPRPYVVQAPDALNTAADVYDVYLDVTALNVNFGFTGMTIIPEFDIEFICADDVGDFFVNLGNCILYALDHVVNGLCCVGNCALAIFSFGFAGQCGGDCGCYTPSTTCETCEYHFGGWTVGAFDLAESLCSDVAALDAVYDAYDENGMCGFFWRIPFSNSMDLYASESWFVDEAAIMDHLTPTASFDPDEIGQTAGLFTLDGIVPGRYSDGTVESTGLFNVQASGGVEPYKLTVDETSTSTIARDLVFTLDEEMQTLTEAGVYENYVLRDANGCVADYNMSENGRVTVANAVPVHVGFCSDDDDDGCNDCKSGSYDLNNDGTDYDGDGLCNVGDQDDDNDGILDAADAYPLDEYLCMDEDGDGCDDCSSGSYDVSADGTDTDGDGLCDFGDADDDNDGVADASDSAPLNSNECDDTDGDGCDDCLNGSYDPANDGADFDGDGACDANDDDADNDGRENALDSNDANVNICSDSDGDGCDDCSSGTYDPANDGNDLDGDGICDSGDSDVDGDGLSANLDSDDTNKFACIDSDGDGCDDCSQGFYDPASDGSDFDSDGICDSSDPDIDGDGALNENDTNDYSIVTCSDTDADGCDDCSLGSYDPNNDGPDLDGDGICDSGDADADGDGIPAVQYSEEGQEYVVLDPDDMSPGCMDWDADGCDYCGTELLTEARDFFSYKNDANMTLVLVMNDGDDADGDGICDFQDAFPSDPNEFSDGDGDGIGYFYDCDDDDSNTGGPATWYADVDNDGEGNAAQTILSCTQPSGYVGNSTDCDDGDSGVQQYSWYPDQDNDGLGDVNGTAVMACTAPTGYVGNSDDCDDTLTGANCPE